MQETKEQKSGVTAQQMHMEGGGKVQPLPVMQEEFAGSLQKD
jgi:hypothetical protein